MNKIVALMMLLPSLLAAQIPLSPSLDTVQVNISEPKQVKEYNAPFMYRRWWKEIQSCTGLFIPTKMTQTVKFFWVAGQLFQVEGTGLYVGYTYAWDNEIYVHKDYVLNEALIKHEMTHILMWHHTKQPGHPPEYYKKECGNTPK
jgi:hypothetical protein